jgi:hypothetical protein
MICARCNTNTVEWTGSILNPTGIKCRVCAWSASGPEPEPVIDPEEGGPCPECRTIGLVFRFKGDGCSCHINPPCGYCTSSYYACDSCNWEDESA